VLPFYSASGNEKSFPARTGAIDCIRNGFLCSRGSNGLWLTLDSPNHTTCISEHFHDVRASCRALPAPPQFSRASPAFAQRVSIWFPHVILRVSRMEMFSGLSSRALLLDSHQCSSAFPCVSSAKRRTWMNDWFLYGVPVYFLSRFRMRHQIACSLQDTV
jgi:hypothetical protein